MELHDHQDYQQVRIVVLAGGLLGDSIKVAVSRTSRIVSQTRAEGGIDIIDTGNCKLRMPGAVHRHAIDTLT